MQWLNLWRIQHLRGQVSDVFSVSDGHTSYEVLHKRLLSDDGNISTKQDKKCRINLSRCSNPTD